MQHYTSHCIDIYGNAISGASIQVYAAGTQTASTIYSDNGVTTTTNPLTSGADGSFDFYAADGRYDLVITHTGHTFSSADTAGIALFDMPIVPTSWTPSLGGNATYTVQNGKYIKLGRLVIITCRLTVNVLGTGSGNVVSGLPFVGEAYNQAISVGYNANLGSSPVSLNAVILTSSSAINIYGRTAGATSVSAITVFADGADITLSGSYFTTS